MLTGKRYYYLTENLRDKMATFFTGIGYRVRRGHDDKACEFARYYLIVGEKKKISEEASRRENRQLSIKDIIRI